VIVNNDIEIWLLFAPFWLLGMFALVGGLWHMVHAWLVTRRAQAAGHVRKPARSDTGLAWHELTDRGRHHLKRAFIGLAAFFALMLLGLGVGAAVGLLLSR
jgi:hypothetical protein